MWLSEPTPQSQNGWIFKFKANESHCVYKGAVKIYGWGGVGSFPKIVYTSIPPLEARAPSISVHQNLCPPPLIEPTPPAINFDRSLTVLKKFSERLLLGSVH